MEYIWIPYKMRRKWKKKKWESYKLDGSHKCNVEQKTSYTKEYILYNSICCIRNDDIPCKGITSRRGQEGAL